MILLALLTLQGCSDTGLKALEKDAADAWPAIVVSPSRLDFWSVGPGEAVTLPFTVTSVGETALRVTSIGLDGTGSFTLVDGAEGFDLLPGEFREIGVVFAPMAPGEQSAVATIASDDAEHPSVTVDLVGDGHVPSLVITPDPWAFGSLPLGCGDSVTLTLQNVGAVDLTVEDLAYAGPGFSFVPDSAPPLTLAPYAYTTGVVTFSPSAAGMGEGVLSVTSDDPRGVLTATQSGEGLGGGTGLDHFLTEADPPVDVLFAIDRSTSMTDDAAGLAAAFSTFIDRMGTVTTGWHIGVVTTDGGCLNGGVLDSSTADIATAFGAAVSFGADLDIVYDEALFRLVDAALDETGSGDCNAGFLREDALLHVIVVSDEPERSPEYASAWTWDWYLPRFESHVTRPSLLVVSGIVDLDGCSEGADGYAEAIAATGGEALSICAGDWGDRLAALAAASLAYTWSFPLSADPVAASIVVTVDGVALAGGWSYDASSNVVVVDTLAPGAAVDVAYDLASACP
ncbi:MAG: choice-of-anchor D domain-containing protein [Pseudomonadota bacterium]|nr:choice-of-anchor D domain-containing protein [Pseudomonadota bacterium]